MTIKEYVYNEDEVFRLYSEAGWVAYTDDMAALREGFMNSLLILAAYGDDGLLGLIRVVGDGATIIFIQDILVFPSFQRQGVGSALLRAVLERFAGVRQIELLTDNTEKTKAFYNSMGFHEFSEIGCCGFMKC
jgi:GNAT superfamily N-acetyltransferase